MADGNILSLSYDDNSAKWTEHDLAQMDAPVTSEVRLRAADVDNNGAVDLLVMPVKPGGNAGGAQIWLQDEAGTFKPMASPQGPSMVFDTADLHGDGHLDLIGLDASGRPVDARSHLTKNYHWQTIRPRARVVRGDQRINPFGIGGEIEIRSALLLQKQAITGPMLHFGLGEHQGVDVARIVWPNGSVRAEFALKADQQIVTEQRLKGSCPFLFAWNGKRMDFVKDSVPWGSAIGLRINSLGTANIAATEEWYKIGRDHLQPRNGFYDLRVTGELWETYFYDSLSLMTVDHPAGTEVFTDERYDVPPVKLAITAVGPPQPIAHAEDDNGNDVTATLRTLDGKYLDNFGRGQYQGVTRDHFVEIDLGDHVPEGWPAVADREGVAASIGFVGKRGHEPGEASTPAVAESGSARRQGRMARRPTEPRLPGGPEQNFSDRSHRDLPAGHAASSAASNQSGDLLGFDGVGAGIAEDAHEDPTPGARRRRPSLSRLLCDPSGECVFA